MSLLFDPLYPTQVQYVVSQPIWELYEIHFWQLLTKSWGKDRVFLYLQNRYESKHRETPALVFMILVFIVSFLVQYLMNAYQNSRPPPAQNEDNTAVNDQNQEDGGDDNNANEAVEVNDDQSNQNQS